MTKHQAAVMATRLFNLVIKDHSSVKELDGYDDRNFYMRGSLKKEPNKLDISACKEYVLKIVNHLDSKHECLMPTQSDVMLFLQSRGHKCPAPVPSVFNSSFVMCKLPRAAQPGSVASATDGTNDVRDLENDTSIYNDEGYSEEEYFVCAVRLLTFVPGASLNEIPLNSQLLFDAGMAVGKLDRDLKVQRVTCYFQLFNVYWVRRYFEREGLGNRHTQEDRTDRQTDRQTGRQTDRQTDS